MTDYWHGWGRITTDKRYWPLLERRYRFMIVRTPDERDEYIATLKARNEELIIREANRIQDRLEHVELELEVPC